MLLPSPPLLPLFRPLLPTATMTTRSINDVLMASARANSRPRKKPKTTDGSSDDAPALAPPPPSPLAAAAAAPPDLSVSDRVAFLRAAKGADFDPKAAAFWKDGEPVPFLFLARALDLIAGESGRIVMTDILCNAFRTVIATTPGDLVAVVYLSANKIAPAHHGVELGIGDAALIKALADAYGRNEKQIKDQLKVSLFLLEQFYRAFGCVTKFCHKVFFFCCNLKKKRSSRLAVTIMKLHLIIIHIRFEELCNFFCFFNEQAPTKQRISLANS